MNKYNLFSVIVIALLCHSCATETMVAQKANDVTKLGNTCYAKYDKERELANYYLNKMKEARDELSKTTDSALKLSILKRLRDNLDLAATLGHPEAFAYKCILATDSKAPRNTRFEGIVWCKVGIDNIPALRAKLRKDVQEAVDQSTGDPKIYVHVSEVEEILCRERS